MPAPSLSIHPGPFGTRNSRAATSAELLESTSKCPLMKFAFPCRANTLGRKLLSPFPAPFGTTGLPSSVRTVSFPGVHSASEVPVAFPLPSVHLALPAHLTSPFHPPAFITWGATVASKVFHTGAERSCASFRTRIALTPLRGTVTGVSSTESSPAAAGSPTLASARPWSWGVVSGPGLILPGGIALAVLSQTHAVGSPFPPAMPVFVPVCQCSRGWDSCQQQHCAKQQPDRRNQRPSG
jgi:hypothetical protein